jgi:septation ring formation regulator EzrA
MGSSMEYGSGGYSNGIEKAAETAKAGSENWRDAMTSIVEDSKKLAEVTEVTNNLNDVAEAIKNIKVTKAKGANIEALASALDHLKQAASGGIHLTAFITSIDKLNEKAGQISSNNTVSVLHELADALQRVKESSEGLQIQNIKINFTGGKGTSGAVGSAVGGMSGGIESTVQQMAADIDGAFKDVESTVSGVNDKVGEFVNALIQVKEWEESSAEEAERMGHAFAYIFEMASKLRSSMSPPWGSMNGLPSADFI